MSDDPRQTGPAGPAGPEDGDDIAAAEYALGLLEAAEARAFAARLAREPALARRLAAWEEHFSRLAEATPATVPPRRLWRRVRRGLDDEPAAAAPGAAWRGLAIGGALTAMLALALLGQTWFAPEPAAPTFTAALEATEALPDAPDGPVARVALEAEGALNAQLEGVTPAPGRSFELWLIAGEAAPVSLGLLAPGEPVRLDLAETVRAALATADPLVLAISDEPAGGSPTGAPTGAVLALGPLKPA